MRVGLGSLAVLLVSCACQPNDRTRADSRATARSSGPVVSASGHAATGAPAPTVNRTPRLPSSFSAAAPKALRYTNLVPEAGTPGPPAFEVGTGPSGATSKASTRWLLIDQGGQVWRFLADANATKGQRVGKVMASDLARMRELSKEAVRHPARAPEGGCDDCATTSYLAYGLSSATRPTVLAKRGAMVSEPTSAACQEVVGWLRAIDARALHLPRHEPLGLSLPIVADLHDAQPGPQPQARAVFELRHGSETVGVGLQVDAAGGVERFQEYDGQRAVLRVGEVPASVVTKLSEESTGGAWQAGAGRGRDCMRLDWFESVGAAPKRLASTCADAGRLSGADALLAWLLAVDEQAARVPHWPLE